MTRILLAALLLCPLAASAQEVKLPAEVRGAPGAWIIVAPESISGGKPRWRIDPGLQEVRLDLLFPSEVAQQAKGKVLTSQVAGTYRVEAWNAKADVASEIATCLVVIGTPGPPAPLPVPVPPVNPPSPSPPLPLAGMRVLVLYETETPLPAAYLTALNSQQVLSYLNEKCLKGPDGKTPEKRYFDDDPSLTNLPQPWQDLRARLPAQLPLSADGKYPVPHVAIGDSSGAVVHSGPYPPTEVEALALFKRFGG